MSRAHQYISYDFPVDLKSALFRFPKGKDVQIMSLAVANRLWPMPTCLSPFGAQMNEILNFLNKKNLTSFPSFRRFRYTKRIVVL